MKLPWRWNYIVAISSDFAICTLVNVQQSGSCTVSAEYFQSILCANLELGSYTSSCQLIALLVFPFKGACTFHEHEYRCIKTRMSLFYDPCWHSFWHASWILKVLTGVRVIETHQSFRARVVVNQWYSLRSEYNQQHRYWMIFFHVDAWRKIMP